MFYINNNLMALAVIPGLVIIVYVYAKDKVEKEPVALILKVMALGVVSCIIAGYAESFAAMFLPSYPSGTFGYAFINAFALAAFWEEILKYGALRIGSWKSSNFNYRFDGVVYGVSSAVGFAIYENIMYVASYGFQTALVRAFTAVPLHAFCGVAMGIFYAYSKKAAILGQRSRQTVFTILSLVVPMLIHGIYDFLAFLGATYILLIFVAIQYVVAIKAIKYLSAEDYRGGFYPKAREIVYSTDL